MKNRAIIDEIVTICANELFAQFDLTLAPVSDSIDPHDYAAVIGFYGDHLRGAVGIGIDRAVVARMFEGGGESRVIAEDCIAEAANQLLGRMKNKLIAYGVNLGSALPMVLRGLEVHLAKTTTDVWPYRFVTPVGGVTIWFDARFSPGFELQWQEGGEALASREGELTMF